MPNVWFVNKNEPLNQNDVFIFAPFDEFLDIDINTSPVWLDMFDALIDNVTVDASIGISFESIIAPNVSFLIEPFIVDESTFQ